MDNKADDLELKMENDFLKLKMMLEHGAEMQKGPDADELTPEMENHFLKHIMEFERQFEEQKMIRVYDKIGRPDHFKPVAEIDDSDIEKAWDELSDYLSEHNINLDACSPNVTARELYRFTVEEFFNEEISDMDIPGMIFGFIYDEFHPDPVYENTRMVANHLIERIFSKTKFEYFYGFRKDKLRFNSYYPVTEEELTSIIQDFQSSYDEFGPPEITDVECTIDGNVCVVNGRYAVAAVRQGQSLQLSGAWSAEVVSDGDQYYWYLEKLEITGAVF
jgi:hypothetical protein